MLGCSRVFSLSDFLHCPFLFVFTCKNGCRGYSANLSLQVLLAYPLSGPGGWYPLHRRHFVYEMIIVLPSLGPMTGEVLNKVYVHRHLLASILWTKLLLEIPEKPEYPENPRRLHYLGYIVAPCPP